MSHTLGIRQAQKQKTRQALLDAALGLLEEQSLSSLGLREVTRAVGVAPTAFYRHFRSTADLGVALVEEALGSLHPMIRTTVADGRLSEQRIARAVELIAGHVDAYPAHVRFIARERHGGVQPVREAIRDQLARFAEEVRSELAKDAGVRGLERRRPADAGPSVRRPDADHGLAVPGGAGGARRRNASGSPRSRPGRCG